MEGKPPAKAVDIGPTDAQSFLDTVAYPALARFQQTESLENAVAAAGALWALRDWAWRDAHPGVDPKTKPDEFAKFTKALITQCPDLELIRDIADSVRHGGQLGRTSVKVAQIVGAGSPGGKAVIATPLGTTETKPACTLQFKLTDGSTKDVPDVLRRVAVFWRKKIQ